jgi:quercetin dioxygenase-like cupin family protein
MEDKSNEATPQRPKGDRPLDAPLVTMDLNHFVEHVRNESTWKDSDRNSITVFKSEKIRIVLIGLHKGAELKTHTANGPITVQVLEGNIKFQTELKIVELQNRQMLTLKENIPHSVLALEETFFLLTMAVI